MQDGKPTEAAPLEIFGAWDDMSFAEMEAYLARNGIEIMMASEEPGQHHVVADGLMSKDHCSQLIPLDIVCNFALQITRQLAFLIKTV